MKVPPLIGLLIGLCSCRDGAPLTNIQTTQEIPETRSPPPLLPPTFIPPTLPPPAPVTQVTSSPTSVWAGEAATIGFDSTIAHSTFECNLDENGFTPCTSPYTVTQEIGTGGVHSLQIRATSPDGTLETTPTEVSWTQENYKTIALFHFDAPNPVVDASYYTSLLNSNLTNASSVSTPGAPGFFEGQLFSESAHMSTPHTPAQSLATSRGMTLEGFIKFDVLPSSTQLMVLASQSGPSGQYGWEFGIVRWGTNFYLYFVGSQDGSTRVEVESPTKIGNLQTIVTGAWYHFAMTFDRITQSTTFYKNGVDFGSAILGSTNSPLFDSDADFRLGFTEDSVLTANYPNPEVGGTLRYFSGAMDEVRLSQVVRPIIVPTTLLSAD
jgi:hypothetical protein